MSEAEDISSIEDPFQVERDAEQFARVDDPAQAARAWLLTTTSATLCTLAAKPDLAGHPFGSVVPFALDWRGHPVIYTASIAAHTANLRHDPRASLFIRQPDVVGDPQAGWRLSLVGAFHRLSTDGADDAEQITQDEHDDIAARYFERVPAARGYASTHSFSFWRMGALKKARYIAGFGKICWLRGDELLRTADEAFQQAAEHAAAHMNDDHVENMREMCRGVYDVSPQAVRMVDVDRTGFALLADEQRYHFSFGKEVDGAGLRHAVIDVLQRARVNGGKL